MRTRWVILLCSLCLAVGLGGGCLVGVLFNFARMEQAIRVEDVTLDTDVPSQVKVGETFKLTITVTDTAGKRRMVRDIDLQDTLVKGATILSVDPIPTSTDNVFDLVSHTMLRPVPANAAAAFTFTLRADAAGTYAGEVIAYIDSDLSSASAAAAFTIVE